MIVVERVGDHFEPIKSIANLSAQIHIFGEADVECEGQMITVVRTLEGKYIEKPSEHIPNGTAGLQSR